MEPAPSTPWEALAPATALAAERCEGAANGYVAASKNIKKVPVLLIQALFMAARVGAGHVAPSCTCKAALEGAAWGSGGVGVSDPPQCAGAGSAPGLAAWEITTALRWRDTISVWLFGFQTQELWDVMEICKSANQTANFKEGKEGLAGRD